MQAVLCVRRGGLGDTLLMLPVLRALRRQHPRAALHFAGVLEFAAVLQRYGAVDRARSSEELELWAPRAAGEAAGRARQRLSGHAAVVLDDPALAFLAAEGLPVRTFDPVVRDRAPVPVGRRWLRALGLREAEGDLEAGLLPPRVAPQPGPVVLHAGSGSPAKCLPAAFWVELAASLLAAGQEVVAVRGPAEIERGEDPPWPRGVARLDDPDLLELCGLLERASAYHGHDSGVTHLAARLSVPTTAYFVATDPRIWAPPGARIVPPGPG